MKIIKYILLGLTLSFYGCENWLDVNPDNQVSSDKLYATGEGYRNQLNGAYKELSDASLYGRNLTWGFIDIWGQYYVRDYMEGSLADVNDFLVEGSSVKAYSEAIWKKMFHVVVNCNQVLERLQKEPEDSFEKGKTEKDLIEGEMLALRAFMHFDLLRMFAPAPKADDGGTYIPYVTEYGALTNKPLSVKDVLTHVRGDLLKARGLVATYDTLGLADKTNANQWGSVIFRLSGMMGVPLFFQTRGYRMNYYAITALLARVCAYEGQMKNAYEYAKEVYDTEYFKFTASQDMTAEESERNRKMYDDIILGFMNNTMAKDYEGYVYSITGRTLALRNMEQVFDGIVSTNDYRYTKLVRELTSDKKKPISLKNISGTSTQNLSLISTKIIPVIRLSELYYIMGEYLCENNVQEAVGLLEKLRTARGEVRPLPAIGRAEEFRKAMLLDARREFIGEGQSLYMYKRFDLPLFDGVREIDMKNKYYLPIPESETVLL